MCGQELILFSRADLERSIPSMVDGLKPGQRKILFACFKRNLRKEIKVLMPVHSEQSSHTKARLRHASITLPAVTVPCHEMLSPCCRRLSNHPLTSVQV